MLEPYEQHPRRKLTATIATIFVVAGVVVGVDQYRSAHPATLTTLPGTSPGSSTSVSSVTTKPSSDTTPSTAPASSTTPAGSYKDGTYSATSAYSVPHGNESIRVSVMLSGGTISGVSIQNSENDFDSQQYQESFASVYKMYVVGQKISSLQLSTVAGASDTTQGFNNALSQIASQAQA